MPKQKRSTKNTQVINADKARSLNDWNKLPLQALHLKCNSYALVEQGTKTVLQNRLYRHFNPTETRTINQTPSTSPPSNIDLQAEIRELRSMILDLHTNNSSQIPANQNPAFNFTATEPVAVSTSQPPPKRKRSVPAVRMSTINSCDSDAESSSTDGIEPDPHTATTTQAQQVTINEQGMSSSILTTPFTTSQGLYAPPAIEQKLLKKIQKGEYIDFALLLPAPHNLAADNYLGVELDHESNLLFKSKVPKSKILNFQDWMYAWNLFLQAKLSYTPTAHAKLFAYQKIFSNLVRKFNFDSCYAYDKNQRTQIASQSTTPLANRTVSWDVIND